MTTKPRQRGGQSAAAKAAKATAAAEAAPANPAPAPAEETVTAPAGDQPTDQPTDGQADGQGDEPADDSPEFVQQGELGPVFPVQGDPVPEQPDQGMVLAETGISPEPFPGGEPLTAATPFDPERNGQATAVGVDKTGELRHVEGAAPTAAFGGSDRNGRPVSQLETQIDKTFGGNGDPTAKLQADGVRAEVGTGTLNPDLPADERPMYPSSTMTRASSDAAPMEPDDVKLATEPKRGVVETSTDPIAAAAVVQSHVGDQMDKLVNERGEEVKPSEFFEPIEGPRGKTLRRVNCRVSELFTVRNVKTVSKRLLFVEGQEVPESVAQQLIALHG